MQSAIPPQDISWLKQQAVPYTDSPVAIFLGGSRGGRAGAVPLAQSDFDVLMVARDMPQGCSLTLDSPHTGAHYDLILRDPDLLAHDITAAQAGGNGTLLHLLSYSAIVEQEPAYGDCLQLNARNIYAQGPRPVLQESFAAEVESGLQSLDQLGRERDETRYHIASLSLSHRFARLAVRGNGQWVANGKVLDRFMQLYMPHFRTRFTAAADKLDSGDSEPLRELVQEQYPRLHLNGADGVPYQQQHDYPDRPTVAQVYHFARLNGRAQRDYLYSPEPETRACSKDWLRYMFNLTGSAVSPERAASRPGEYRMALGRYLNQLMDVAALEHRFVPHELPLSERVLLFGLRLPALATALPAARQGQPQELHALAATLVEKVAGPAQPFRPRPMPRSCRASARDVGLIY